MRLPPISIPAWLASEIEGLLKLQANSRASVIRQLLVEAIEAERGQLNFACPLIHPIYKIVRD